MGHDCRSGPLCTCMDLTAGGCAGLQGGGPERAVGSGQQVRSWRRRQRGRHCRHVHVHQPCGWCRDVAETLCMVTGSVWTEQSRRKQRQLPSCSCSWQRFVSGQGHDAQRALPSLSSRLLSCLLITCAVSTTWAAGCCGDAPQLDSSSGAPGKRTGAVAAAMTVDTRLLPCSTDGCSMPSCCWIASSAVLSSTCRRCMFADQRCKVHWTGMYRLAAERHTHRPQRKCEDNQLLVKDP